MHTATASSARRPGGRSLPDPAHAGIGSDVVVVSAVRTAVGTYLGGLRDVPAHVLGATVIRTAVERARLAPDEVAEVVMGQVGQIGADAYNARRCSMAAGLPPSTTAMNVNRLCGSGLQAISSAAQEIRLGEAGIVVAGGNESMTRQPFLDFATRVGGGALGDRTLVDGTLSLLTDPLGGYPMGETAERVAERFSVTREEQDAFALESQRRATAAITSGRFEGQIVPVQTADGSFERDEHPRPGVTAERLAALKPVFRKGGTVTAGNSSGINDGAAAVVLMSRDWAEQRSLPVLGSLRAVVTTGIEPEVMGYAPVGAIRKLVERTGVALDDVDVIELNEAFAAQAVAVIRELSLNPARVNPNGGAIALGHPIGATGAILTVKLLYELERTGGHLGVVALCIGGGQAIAALFERA